MISDRLIQRFYSDPKYNGTSVFYRWVREYTQPNTVILNLGAGPPTLNRIRQFKGEVAEVVGADIDPIVLANPELDRAFLIVNGKLPFNDASFDVVLSDYVLEHVAQPVQFLAEVKRVLKPNASFFFRTSNLFHYVTGISVVTPHWVHTAVANKVRALSENAHDPWPTHYRMNTRSKLRRLAEQVGYSATEMRTIECEPSYLVFNPAAFMVGVAYERLVNSFEFLSDFRVNILGRFIK